MIVRLMGEGQFQLPADAAAELNEIDNAAVVALERDDEAAFRDRLAELCRTVRERGRPLDEADLHPSDLIVPPEDLTLEEARELFSGDGLIPDLPT